MVDLCIADRFSKIDLLQHITKLVRPAVRTYFISLALACVYCDRPVLFFSACQKFLPGFFCGCPVLFWQ